MEKEIKYLKHKLQNLKDEEREFIERGTTYGLRTIREEIGYIESLIDFVKYFSKGSF